MKYHGINKVDDNKAYFCFGIEYLISRCQDFLWRSIEDLPDSLRDSLERFNNRTYWQCAKKTRETVFKIDKAITEIGKCIVNFENKNYPGFEKNSPEGFHSLVKVSGDIPYHFDSLISYLRILADCISFAIPFFYRTSKSIANRSFRDHRKWFINKQPNFDQEYHQILKDNTEWFDQLAGKEPKGIRDILFHNFATYQFGYKLTPTGKNELFVYQVTSKGLREPNLNFTIGEIITGFFHYLDNVYELFGSRIVQEFHPYIERDLGKLSEFYKISNLSDENDYYRLYPDIEVKAEK